MKAAVGLLVVSLLLVGCDHATKRVAKSTLEGEAPRPVVGRVLDLQYRENRDSAFGLLRWVPEGPRGVLLKVFGAAALATLATMLFRRRRLDLTTGALVLLLAGAAGNYGDRLFRGYVIDFIHVPYWPVFNVADAYVTVALALLLLAHWRSRPAPSSP